MRALSALAMLAVALLGSACSTLYPASSRISVADNNTSGSSSTTNMTPVNSATTQILLTAHFLREPERSFKCCRQSFSAKVQFDGTAADQTHPD